jgi:hypothetical protein
VRTGKRYGKTSLTARHGRDLARAIAECRYLLRDLDPDGTRLSAERVGLMTFKDCKAAMAEALGIPAHRTGHFSRLRESLALEDCDILLVVGTPTLRPEDVARLARAYYHADPQLLDETSVRGEDGRWHYRDARRHARGRRAHARRADPMRASQPSAALRRAGSRDAVRGGHPLSARDYGNHEPAAAHAPRDCRSRWRVGLPRRRGWPRLPRS